MIQRTLCLPIAILAIGTWCCAQEISVDDALAHARATYSEQGAKAALPEFEQVLDSYRKTGGRRGEAITLGLIGNCYKRLGDYPKALALLNAALQMKRELHDRGEEGKTLSHLGLVYWEQGEYAKAIDVFKQSISIAGEVGDIRLEAASLNNLSLVYDEQGNYRQSLEQYQHALELHRSAKFERGESDTLGNIGGVYLLLGRYSEAERHYREALEISKRLGLKPSESQDLGNIAQCLLGQGKIQESLNTYDQAISLAKDAGLAKEEADWYRGKASALLLVGKFDDALRNYQSSGEVYSKAGLKRELVENLGDVGNAHLELGDRQGAEKSFVSAISVSRQIGYKRGIVVNQIALAEIHLRASEYLEAEKTAESGLTLARKIDDSAEIVNGLLLIGRILRKHRQFQSSLHRTEEAAELAQKDGLRLFEATALDQEGDLKLKLQRPEEALLPLAAARAIANEAGDTNLYWLVEYHRGQCLERLHRNEEALQAYRSSVDSIESVRVQISQQSFRTGYFQDKQRVYIALVQLLLKMGRDGEAFGYSEELREYSYQNLSDRPFLTESSPAVLEVRTRLSNLQERLTAEYGRPIAHQRAEAIQTLFEELSDAQKQYDLLLKSSSLRSRIGSMPSASAICEVLPRNVAVVEYVVADDQLAIFTLTSTGLQATTQSVAERNLRSKVELFRDLVLESSADQWRKPAESLHALLISPIERKQLLSGIETLVIVPHGILDYLPFAALPKNLNGRTSFLIQKYEIIELPAASLLTTPPPTHRIGPPTRIVSFAPSRSGLKFAIPEARDIAAIFGTGGEAVLGRNATITQFRANTPDYDIIHIATHGFFNKANPILSGLQFEPDAIDDGRLEVHDILRMRFQAQLVTLSACDTALGGSEFDEIPAGDEFVGLNRAFLEAGSGSVIASLWKVDDRSTLELMASIYRRIRKVGGPRALADAQRAMLRNPYYNRPYYWAAFIYTGRTLESFGLSAEKH